MDLSRKRSMLSNLPTLKIVSTLTMFTNSQRRFMGSSKPQEHGMNACKIFLSLMTSKSEKPILHSLLKLLQKTCLYAKFSASYVEALFCWVIWFFWVGFMETSHDNVISYVMLVVWILCLVKIWSYPTLIIPLFGFINFGTF
jgi:hypothetical protein